MIEFKHISKVYPNGTVGLNDINLTIKPGEFIVIVGLSGAGKSTLLNIIATIDTVTSGEIIIDGASITHMNEDELTSFRREKLGFIFQDYNLLDTLTVRENILLPLALAKMNVADMQREVDIVSDKFGIRSILDKYPYQISGGQKQRTAVSRAIIAKPSLILADEPTGALDSKSATDLLESLKDLSEYDKATILMVTHDAYAASYCSRVLFIKDGQLFTELVKGKTTRKEFFQKVLDVLSALGGGSSDIN